VLLGCAHAGLVNTLEHVRDLTNGRPFHTVLGGTHLRGASEARLQWTLAALRRFEISRLGTMHCTGLAASVALWTAFPDRCAACGVGSTFDF
jgi:7,8-dihydropterin-6-yl-methyl-4-(beta-D-ribofuranosyl)aminobenzene 5'-phosphate synthase